MVGDSISMHYGPHLKRMLEGVFEYHRKEGVESGTDLDKASGANGGDSAMVRDYLQGLSIAGRLDYDVIMINCGLHDIKTNPETRAKQVPILKYEENLRGILSLLGKTRARTVWVRSTPVNDPVHNGIMKEFERYADDLDAYNLAADRIMAGFGVTVIDLYTFTKNLGDGLYCDHVHFRDEICALQAAFIAGHLFSLESQGYKACI